MKEFHNAVGKRVCDVSTDYRIIEIKQKGYITRITANNDGTLNLINIPLIAA